MEQLQTKRLEDQLRWKLRKLGYRLNKRRGGLYEGYMILDLQSNFIIAGSSPIEYSLNIEDVTAWINNEK